MPTGRSIQNWASPGIEALFMALLSYCQENEESDTFHCHFIRKWLKPKPIAVHNQRKSLPNASFVSHTHRVQGFGGQRQGILSFSWLCGALSPSELPMISFGEDPADSADCA